MNQRDFYDRNSAEYCSKQKQARLVIAKKDYFSNFDLKGLNVLDLGCGTGEMLNYLKGFDSYLGVDFSEKLVDIANKQSGNKNVVFIQGDIREDLGLDTYDLVILNDVIHHTDFGVIKNAVKYLAKGGKLIISEPILKDCKGKNFGYVWFDRPLNEVSVKHKMGSRYDLEHPQDFEFSIPELKQEFVKNKLKVFKEYSSQYNVLPFINRTSNYFYVRLNSVLEQVLIKLMPRLYLQGSRYTAILCKGLD